MGTSAIAGVLIFLLSLTKIPSLFYLSHSIITLQSKVVENS